MSGKATNNSRSSSSGSSSIYYLNKRTTGLEQLQPPKQSNPKTKNVGLPIKHARVTLGRQNMNETLSSRGITSGSVNLLFYLKRVLKKYTVPRGRLCFLAEAFSEDVTVGLSQDTARVGPSPYAVRTSNFNPPPMRPMIFLRR